MLDIDPALLERTFSALLEQYYLNQNDINRFNADSIAPSVDQASFDFSMPFPEDDTSSATPSLKRKADASQSLSDVETEQRSIKKAKKGAVACCYCLETVESLLALEFHQFKYHGVPMKDLTAPKKTKYIPKECHPCQKCEKTFESASGRRRHVKKMHPAPEVKNEGSEAGDE